MNENPGTYYFDVSVFDEAGRSLGVVTGTLPLGIVVFPGHQISISVDFAKIPVNIDCTWHAPTLVVQKILTVLSKKNRHTLLMEDLILPKHIISEDFFYCCEHLFGFFCDRNKSGSE